VAEFGDDKKLAAGRDWPLHTRSAAAQKGRCGFEKVRVDAADLRNEVPRWFNEGKGQLQQY
jgi:hypothetical protein